MRTGGKDGKMKLERFPLLPQPGVLNQEVFCVFYALVFGILTVVYAWRSTAQLLGKRSTEEVLTGKCIPLFDKAMGVCNLLAALAFALLGASFFILRSPVPALLVHILFLLAVLLVILLMAARTFLQQDHFY